LGVYCCKYCRIVNGTERNVFFFCVLVCFPLWKYICRAMKWNQPVAASTIQRHGMCRLQPKPRTDPGSVRARELVHIHVASAKHILFSSAPTTRRRWDGGILCPFFVCFHGEITCKNHPLMRGRGNRGSRSRDRETVVLPRVERQSPSLTPARCSHIFHCHTTRSYRSPSYIHTGWVQIENCINLSDSRRKVGRVPL
jgi:hypothetical protein